MRVWPSVGEGARDHYLSSTYRFGGLVIRRAPLLVINSIIREEEKRIPAAFSGSPELRINLTPMKARGALLAAFLAAIAGCTHLYTHRYDGDEDNPPPGSLSRPRLAAVVSSR